MTLSPLLDPNRFAARSGIGGRIRAARRACGLTQEGLAHAIGVTRSAVAQWETDRAGQVGANLAAVATALGVTTEYLFAGQAGTEASNASESADEMALRRLYRACTAEDRAFLLRTAVRLARQAEREQRAGEEQTD